MDCFVADAPRNDEGKGEMTRDGNDKGDMKRFFEGVKINYNNIFFDVNDNNIL